MKKIGDVTSTADDNGEFTNGNVAAGIPPTILESAWFNSLQREILNVLIKAEIDQNGDKDDQLANAIEKLAGDNISDAIVQLTGKSEDKVMSQNSVTVELDKKLNKNSFGTIPIGATIEWQSSAPIPDGFMANEGRNFSEKDYPELAKVFPSLKLPDDRGYVKRGLDITGTVDTNGKTRKVGDIQGDAIRNIEGYATPAVNSDDGAGHIGVSKASGAIFRKEVPKYSSIPNSYVESKTGPTGIYFDASRVVPTAAENRMKNKAIIFITRVK